MSTSKELQEQMKPAKALERLLEGNRRFVEQGMDEQEYQEQVNQTAGGQYPFAAVLGCIDSRVPSELVFDQGIGDIFNARVAGNVVNEDILGSLEYACKVAGSKLILVLGHTSCGAVGAAVNQVELGNIRALLSKIKPALPGTGDASMEVDEVAKRNVHLSIRRIREESKILAEMESKGEILIKGAMYDVSSGKVSLLDQ
jgi:carbonic anhydrase